MASPQRKKIRFPREFLLLLLLGTRTTNVEPLVSVRAVGKKVRCKLLYATTRALVAFSSTAQPCRPRPTHCTRTQAHLAQHILGEKQAKQASDEKLKVQRRAKRPAAAWHCCFRSSVEGWPAFRSRPSLFYSHIPLHFFPSLLAHYLFSLFVFSCLYIHIALSIPLSPSQCLSVSVSFSLHIS